MTNVKINENGYIMVCGRENALLYPFFYMFYQFVKRWGDDCKLARKIHPTWLVVGSYESVDI